MILDPFAGSGSTLAAAEALGLASIGIERHAEYFRLARAAVPRLQRIETPAADREVGIRRRFPPPANRSLWL